MFKSSVRNILVTINAVSLMLLFSITSFSDGYSFQEDGDALNESFSGTNYVYTNGIYVGEMGAIDAYMDNYGNTYNGTNYIDATAYPGVGQDDNSTYNGSLAVTANDLMSSKTTVDDATVNASTTVTANEVLTDNNLNAGVQFNNSTFNDDVSLNGSGAVNLAGSTVNNLILGNIPQMETLIGLTQDIGKLLAIVQDNLKNSLAQDTASRTIYAGTYLGTITYNLTYAWVYTYSFSNQQIVRTSQAKYVSYQYLLTQGFVNICQCIQAWSQMFAEWFYPLRNANSQYWIAFNTDTEQYDHVNLATVFGYITWYLGQLYIQGNEAAADISESVSDLDDTLTTLNTTESTIYSNITSSLDTVDSYFNLPVITGAGVVIGWLQYMWVSLGMFQGVTIIAWALIILAIVTGFYKVKRITV